MNSIRYVSITGCHAHCPNLNRKHHCQRLASITQPPLISSRTCKSESDASLLDHRMPCSLCGYPAHCVVLKRMNHCQRLASITQTALLSSSTCKHHCQRLASITQTAVAEPRLIKAASYPSRTAKSLGISAKSSRTCCRSSAC